jgi:arylsulfatase A-like enzyme
MLLLPYLLMVLVACQGTGKATVGSSARPAANVVLIISDDAGYADFSMNGSTHFPTPNIDRIGSEGVRFSEGYVSASVCSPSRAGMLTGRYQQAFGHHHNIPPKYSEVNGLPVEELTIADVLHERGYRTIALGKWHLGYAPHFHPLSRGFDDYYGFLQGARAYWPKKGNQLNQLLRDREPIEETFEYMTDALGDEAAAYIDTHADRPFFMYLCFNAVHTPLHATEEKIALVEESLPERRRNLAAMTMSLDDAVGSVLDALDRNDIAENTLVVFVNDNGGQTRSGMDNGPLRGRKGQPYEGGIRVPFVARWPERWPSGLVFDDPVSTLDLMPTALHATDKASEIEFGALDGVDLTPWMTGEATGAPHEVLFWCRRDNFAVRAGDLKLVRNGEGPVELFDIERDPNETMDLVAERPADVARLQALFDKWDSGNAEPRW